MRRRPSREKPGKQEPANTFNTLEIANRSGVRFIEEKLPF